MKRKLSKSELKRIESLSNRVSVLLDYFCSNDVPLNHGNVSVYTQISIALAALYSILQEY